MSQISAKYATQLFVEWWHVLFIKGIALQMGVRFKVIAIKKGLPRSTGNPFYTKTNLTGVNIH